MAIEGLQFGVKERMRIIKTKNNKRERKAQA